MNDNQKSETARMPLTGARLTILNIVGPTQGGRTDAEGEALPLVEWKTSQKGYQVASVGRGYSLALDNQTGAKVLRDGNGCAVFALHPVCTSDSSLEGVLGGMSRYGSLSARERAELEEQKRQREARSKVTSLLAAGFTPQELAKMASVLK